jgi:hypothetical protein
MLIQELVFCSDTRTRECNGLMGGDSDGGQFNILLVIKQNIMQNLSQNRALGKTQTKYLPNTFYLFMGYLMMLSTAQIM